MKDKYVLGAGFPVLSECRDAIRLFKNDPDITDRVKRLSKLPKNMGGGWELILRKIQPGEK